MEDYKNLVKRNALYKTDALIRHFHLDYTSIRKFLIERKDVYFTDEEMHEISTNVNEIINSQDRFDLYCRNQGLMNN